LFHYNNCWFILFINRTSFNDIDVLYRILAMLETSIWGIIGICIYIIAIAFSFFSIGFSLILYLIGGLAIALVAILYAESPIEWVQWIIKELLLFVKEPWSSIYVASLIFAIYISFQLIESIFGFGKPLIAWGLNVFLYSMLGISLVELITVYLFDLSVVSQLIEIISPAPPAPVPTTTAIAESTAPKEEVFHIKGNNYTYEDAQNLCRVYGATLATYDQIEQSYQKGGEWCEYGWSDHQSVFFPAQRSTWDLLKNIPGHEHSCGRPGVNGGYMNDASAKFGVNCFGIKPPKPDVGTQETATATEEETEEETRRRQRREQLARDAELSWFNFEKWSAYFR